VLLTTAAGVIAILAVVVFLALAKYRGLSHAHH
jgi:DHA2 family multidrug resistance protein-like MFS transporter